MSKGFGMNAAEVSPHGLPVPAGGDATRRRDLRAIPINAHLVTLLPDGRQYGHFDSVPRNFRIAG
jgi:hypothetical protein